MPEFTKEQVAEIFEQNPHLDKLHFTEDGNFHTTVHEHEDESYAPGFQKFVDGQYHTDKTCKIVKVEVREAIITIEDPAAEPEQAPEPIEPIEPPAAE